MEYGKIRRIMLLFVTAALMACLSCTIWNQREWQNLENKKFQFHKFAYYMKGGDKKTAFGFMKDFPLDETQNLVEKKYGIIIDRTGFSAFLAGGDESAIKVFGIILPERFTWESPAADTNTVEFEYENSFIEDSTEIRRVYSLTLKSGGKIRAAHSDTVSDMSGVVKSLSSKLSLGDSREKDIGRGCTRLKKLSCNSGYPE